MTGKSTDVSVKVAPVEMSKLVRLERLTSSGHVLLCLTIFDETNKLQKVASVWREHGTRPSIVDVSTYLRRRGVATGLRLATVHYVSHPARYEAHA